MILLKCAPSGSPGGRIGGFVVAAVDPQILLAWIELYNHTETVTLWEGRTVSGRELAQFLQVHRIPVVWDYANICGGNSCSVITLTPEGAVYAEQAPIFIRPSLQGDRPAFITEDIEGVVARDLSSVTVAMYVDDWQ